MPVPIRMEFMGMTILEQCSFSRDLANPNAMAIAALLILLLCTSESIEKILPLRSKVRDQNRTTRATPN